MPSRASMSLGARGLVVTKCPRGSIDAARPRRVEWDMKSGKRALRSSQERPDLTPSKFDAPARQGSIRTYAPMALWRSLLGLAPSSSLYLMALSNR